MKITATTTHAIEVPDGADLCAEIDRSVERLRPVRYAAGGVWVLDTEQNWAYYRRTTET